MNTMAFNIVCKEGKQSDFFAFLSQPCVGKVLKIDFEDGKGVLVVQSKSTHTTLIDYMGLICQEVSLTTSIEDKLLAA